MATDEEIRKTAEKLRLKYKKGVVDLVYFLDLTIRKGIQIERERIREQVNKNSIEVNMPDGSGWNFVIGINDIDIWDKKEGK